jgi:hypothetical protein
MHGDIRPGCRKEGVSMGLSGVSMNLQLKGVENVVLSARTAQ